MMDRNLALEFVRITEAASLACSQLTGRGDAHGADQAAVDAMRKAFEDIAIDGTIVIGEGERDEAPMLYIGEKVGRAGPDCPQVDIALDPLEGTNICAHGGVGALSVIAVADKGHFLHAPDTYMDKIAVGPGAKGVVSFDQTPEENIRAVAEALNKSVTDVTIVILERERNQQLIDRVRELGSRILLIEDGDVSAGVATSWKETGIDMLLGIGAAPEGVITAAALKCLGGDFLGKIKWQNEKEKERATQMGITNLDKVYSRDELSKGDVMFCATGVTDGPLLKGVRYLAGGRILTQSVVMRSKTGTIRFIESEHNMRLKPTYFSGGLRP